ncbi:LOW QUALITY PROTEIN: Golgi-associated RAB2 interactor protein 4-like [Mustela lutreola]|uniref:LOW QUALITY PROTEIN: Golgi-associated RAB2 interactor protein 4-like n=1 Tax=Mustela lutreola TaxID=9666 RepID=UPI002797619E|nr:LOW QUALITY PROTEIN: Golgi-associated RAB2 interactor protein 4-like [Mustela lutreola]XP_059002397.1 LOW QUALITY PROTEIN: Golgi-associated RAB2 interactor protein 4-like [Mustela lutreola]
MESLTPYHTAHSASRVGMFNTAMGKLQRQLRKGEYDLFKYAPMLESDFVQVTKRGEVVDVHNRIRMMTVGIASTSPSLPLPDVLLLARPATGCEQYSDQGHATKGKGRKASTTLELTRLLPLKFVRLSVHDREKQMLRLKFATGRSCYLRLSPPLDAQEDLFPYWESIIQVLRPPPVPTHSRTDAARAEDMLDMPLLEDDDGRNAAGADVQIIDQDQVSVRSLPEGSEVAGATSAAFAGGEQTIQAPPKTNSLPTFAAPNCPGLSRESAAGATSEAAAAGEAAAAAAVAAAGTAAEFAAGEAGRCLAFAGPGAAGKPAGEAARDASEGQLLWDAPSSAGSGEPAGRPPRKRREEERAPRTSRHRRAADSRRKARGHKIAPADSSRSLGSHRAAREHKEDKGRSSPARGRRAPDEGISHAPSAKDSGTSHKSGRSVSGGSSGSGTKMLGRIRRFLRNLRVSLTARRAASPHRRDVPMGEKTADTSGVVWRPSPRRRRAARAWRAQGAGHLRSWGDGTS